MRRSTSLALFVGAVTLLGLGLAPRVWSAPPAPSEPASLPAADVESAESVESADAPAEPSAEPESDSALGESSNVAGIPDAITLRTRMEEGMAEIGELAVEARAEADLVRATCVLDKQDRANDVMELGTGELMVIRDSTTTEQSRQFAVEKLDAAAGRVDKLVEEAKACAGQKGPEDEIDVTRNDSEEPRTLPIWDPTAGLGNSPVPPPVDGGWPPAASPIE